MIVKLLKAWGFGILAIGAFVLVTSLIFGIAYLISIGYVWQGLLAFFLFLSVVIGATSYD